ncbi:hypothetical protein RvY_17893-2 [Ramazzottius varieornatus]|uniref:RPAP1 C-terminal domain-containing protein n=1 Tax=Ramazzottius varieornatus TaxID=947166 RepID=A0A1D1W3Z2_RAMVA|nr:hypothetical protein RvY_17893-2 [Ramazzottius varieornatus]
MQQSSVSNPNSAAPAKPRSRYYMQKMREKQILTGNAIELPAEPTPETQTVLPKNSEAASVANTSSVSLGTDGPAILPKPKIEKLAEGSYLKIEELNLEGVVEKQKLAWMDGNVPDTKPVFGVTSFDEKGTFEARFDAKGNILPPDTVVPVTAGLHHHGADPEKPGYTLVEILTLLQSSSPPQKLWALKTFSAILHKAKHSLYDEYLSGSLLAKMVDEDMILPLRFLLDSTSLPLIAAALTALESLLVNDIDEFVMEEILTVDRDPYFFELCPEVTTDNETPDESEVLDAQLIKQDVVKGFLRTGILRRIEYLLHSFSDSLEPSTIVSIFRITTRFVQHSVEIAQKICTEESSLLDILMSDAMTVKAPLSQMRLLRVVTSVLGPVSRPWAMKMYQQPSRWIVALQVQLPKLGNKSVINLSFLKIILNCFSSQTKCDSRPNRSRFGN